MVHRMPNRHDTAASFVSEFIDKIRDLNERHENVQTEALILANHAKQRLSESQSARIAVGELLPPGLARDLLKEQHSNRID